MFTVEFHCDICDQRFEQQFSRAEGRREHPCPVCRKPARRVWNCAGLHQFRFMGGIDHSSGKHFETERQMREWKARQNGRYVTER